ncbi:SDR family NAD(P)-dependent oxidoreductase [Paraburkholderia polaris]|nr:SDR family NAD(P)-dependent oxidoreductase [Paraburkholderia polaris]
MVERLARDGFAVSLVDNNGELAEKEARSLREQGLKVDAHAVDITDVEKVHSLIDALPPLTALVNNASPQRRFRALLRLRTLLTRHFSSGEPALRQSQIEVSLSRP